MSSVSAAVLEAVGGEKLALVGVEVEARLCGLLAEAMLTQTYRNLEDCNIEAVYSFPLPLDAVLLGLTLEIGDRKLTAVLQERADASTQYEEALEAGNTAILLERSAPGLYTANIGNLMPGERAVLRYQYAQLLRWQGETLRYQMPTTLAPRYGDPSSAGLAPHQEPEFTLGAASGFSLSLRLEGSLAGLSFECPSHHVSISDSDRARVLNLSGGRVQMDRDFVLVLRDPERGHSEALVAPSDEGYVVMASLQPKIPVSRDSSPRCVKLIVDCSGSMQGDSIAQAKVALTRIVDGLSPNDHFNIVAFGSNAMLLFPRTVAASVQARKAALSFVESLNAYMGGTDMRTALKATVQSPSPPDLPADILLITDGEVWDLEAVISSIRSSAHRIFTIGVGSSVAEATVRGLAEATGGACELVSPREDMAERIVRHFQRIDQPAASAVTIDWGLEPQCQAPGKIDFLYSGDTLHVFGWLPEEPKLPIRLCAKSSDGREFVQEIPLQAWVGNSQQSPTSLERVGASRRLSELDGEQFLQLALKSGLVTERTSYVLLDEQTEAKEPIGIPQLRKIPHSVPAGWGGVGILASQIGLGDYLQQPMFMRAAGVGTSPMLGFYAPPFRELAITLGLIMATRRLQESEFNRLETLERSGLSSETARDLHLLIEEGFSETDVVEGFLMQIFTCYESAEEKDNTLMSEWVHGKELPDALLIKLAQICHNLYE